MSLPHAKIYFHHVGGAMISRIVVKFLHCKKLSMDSATLLIRQHQKIRIWTQKRYLEHRDLAIGVVLKLLFIWETLLRHLHVLTIKNKSKWSLHCQDFYIFVTIYRKCLQDYYFSDSLKGLSIESTIEAKRECEGKKCLIIYFIFFHLYPIRRYILHSSLF